MPDDSTAVLTVVNRTLELPTLPEVLVKLNALLADPEVAAPAVANVIAADPAVATNVLRLVNSSYYGLQVRVATVSLAVTIMGFSMIRRVALNAAVLSQFARREHQSAHFDPAGFWQHSIFTAVAARALGAESRCFTTTHLEDLYVCGLLHDVGRIILIDRMRERYHAVLAQATTSTRPADELEREALGFDHTDVGSTLAVRWRLPEELAAAIRYHHAPARDPSREPLSSLLRLADQLAISAGYPSRPHASPPPPLDPAVHDAVGLTPQAVADLLPQIRADYAATALPW